MQKHFLFFVVLLAVGSAAYSQSHFGIKGGLNYATQRNRFDTTQTTLNESLQTKGLWGHELGVFYKVFFGARLSLSTEANFSAVGSQIQYSNTNFTVNADGSVSGGSTGYYSNRIGYLEIPLMLHYTVGDFYAGAGPGLAVKLFSRAQNSSGREADNYKTLDGGANILAGYSLSRRLDLNLRYSHGLTNIEKQDAYLDTRNRLLKLSVLYTVK